ncbi:MULTISPECIES: SusC/RagA family TonB-linked outer membrane protein [Salinibacter]|uniref:SusC/RagA family TonB-linked outer membrane protein n=1 Tax=Salinibacter TaxID=146918 RepID=UPI001ABB7CB2|nr:MULTISPECIES: SusC/RagA family TonB-linked outer membrane protein [Salinibacter]
MLRYSVLLLGVLLGALCFSPTSSAQDPATVRGVVTDSTGAPLPGANVRVQGTQTGVSADADGAYELAAVRPGRQTIVFSFVGFEKVSRTLELSAGDTRTLDITLGAGTVDLENVVVTALGVDREERSLGYSVERVSGSDVAEAPEPNVMNNLSGKVSGLNVTGGSGGLASTPRVTIRGESSLAGSNRPLIVVDGIPIDNTPNTQGSDAQTTQVDFGNGLSQINAQNISEMSVLKGPSAAALYGSRAADGVILIETKDGSETDGIGATVRTSVTASRPLRLPDYQNEYGYGNGGEFAYVDGTNAPGWNWGVRMDEGVERPQWQGPRNEAGELVPTEVTSAPNKVRNFFNTGTNVSTDVAVRGGGENSSFRASLSRSDRTGIVPNTDLDRTSTSLSASYDVTDALTVDANANYATTTSDNLPSSGYGSESIMYYFTWGARHVENDLLKDYWREEGTQQAHYDRNWTNNPYFQVNENTNGLDRDRLYGGVSARYEFTDNLNLRARTGLDYSNQGTKQRKAFSSITAPNGWLQETDRTFTEWNSNLLLNYTREVGDFTFEPSVGANFMRQTRRNVQLTAQALSVPDVYNIGNARSNVQADERDEAQEILGVFASGTVSYQDLLFLDLTGRNDWSSTLPLDNNSYFYPSASLSVIVSDLVEVPESLPLSFAKVRASWAQVGNDTDPFRLTNTYTFGEAWGSTQTVVSETDLANANLQPEITSSYEVGTNLRFYGGRAQLDVTYYRSTTRDQILSVPLAQSTGYNSRLVNAGEIRNTGVETRLQLSPIQDWSGFGWDVSLNWTRNRSTVVELADGIDTFVLGEGPFGGSAQAREGGRMGDIYGRVFDRVEAPNSPHTGEIIYEDGLPQLTDNVEKVGNYNHDWRGGIGSTFSYENLQLNVLFDVRKGGLLYSNTHATGIEGGSLEGTTRARNETVVGDGVVQNDDGTFSENTKEAEYVTWLRTYYDRPNVESNSFDATYVKLRELSLRYNFTPDWLTRAGVQNVGVSVTGRNLFLWTDVPHVDPETTISGGDGQIPGFEVQQIPSTRSFGMNVQLDF